jgi:N6-L-threonylcarbamoyladenine synthase
MIILAIETSCDETALSLLETKNIDGKLQFKVLNNSVLSQIKLHEQYGGVFPMMAKREHAKNLTPLLSKVLKETGFKAEDKKMEIETKLKELLGEKESELLEQILKTPEIWSLPTKDNKPIDAIAVTQGPGLEPALWVGINFAKALNLLWGVPVIPANHMEGHIVASLLDNNSHNDYHSLRTLEFPALALLISGGHTELVNIKDHRHYKIIGKTRDDAVGEAFDKVARLLGLPYPGGPQISNLADQERKAHPVAQKRYVLPRPMLTTKDFDFSFSGIKTAVLYMTKEIKEITPDIKQQIAREFEDAVTEVLIRKTKKAIEEYGSRALIIGGGVIANRYIREQFELLAKEFQIPLLLPGSNLSTDNALMIGIAGALSYVNEKPSGTSFKADGNLALS